MKLMLHLGSRLQLGCPKGFPEGLLEGIYYKGTIGINLYIKYVPTIRGYYCYSDPCSLRLGTTVEPIAGACQGQVA